MMYAVLNSLHPVNVEAGRYCAHPFDRRCPPIHRVLLRLGDLRPRVEGHTVDACLRHARRRGGVLNGTLEQAAETTG